MHEDLLQRMEKEAKALEHKRNLMARLPRAWSGQEIMTTIFPPPKMSVVGDRKSTRLNSSH